MRRLLRWTFHALAAASLLLCLATAGLWVRSYWVYDEFVALRRQVIQDGAYYVFPHSYLMAESYRGQFAGRVFWWGRPQPNRMPRWEFELRHPPEPRHIDPPSYWLINKRDVSAGYPWHSLLWGVRAWPVVSALALLPAVVTIRQVRAVRRRRHRSRLGLCAACGYDLRASPGRCPECGRQGDKVNG